MSSRKTIGDLSELHDNHINVSSNEIYFYCDINNKTACSLLKNINFLISNNLNKTIKVFLQSDGGCLYSSLGLYDYISSLSQTNIEIIVMGNAFSGAALLLQSADKRVCMPSSKIMIHEGHAFVPEDNLNNIKEFISAYENEVALMVEIFAAKTGQKTSVLKKKMKNDIYLNAEEALEMGLVDEIWGS